MEMCWNLFQRGVSHSGSILLSVILFFSPTPAEAPTKPKPQAECLCVVNSVRLPPAPFYRTFHTEPHLNFCFYCSSLQILVMLECRFLEDNYGIIFLYSVVHPCLAHRGLLCKQPARKNGTINQAVIKSLIN